MTEYPYEIFELPHGMFKLEFRELPTLQFVGSSRQLLCHEAASALNAFLSKRIRNGLPIPPPSASSKTIRVADQVDLRLRLYWSMQDRGWTREQLAENLGLGLPVIEDLFDGAVESDTPSVFSMAVRGSPLTGAAHDTLQKQGHAKEMAL